MILESIKYKHERYWNIKLGQLKKDYEWDVIKSNHLQNFWSFVKNIKYFK